MNDTRFALAPSASAGPSATQAVRLSISAVRRMLTCGESERLVRAGHRPAPTAAMWYGRLVHAIIARAYGGADLETAFGEVWTRECGGILPLLEQWAILHDDRLRHGGRAGTKARAAWEAAHPAYDALAARIAAYQETALQHYRWTTRGSVADYYWRSRQLVRAAAAALLLPGAVLVEGRLIGELPEGSTLHEHALALAGTDGDDEEPDQIRLRGMLGRVEVVGVPDVVAYDAEVAVWRVADYKTSKTQLRADELRDDAQLQLYLHLLQQAGIIPAGAHVQVGHLYLSEALTAVWTEASDLLAPPSRLHQQVELLARQIEREEYVPVRGVLNGWTDRCGDCLLAHACAA